jgi:[CysO sulfur-carrier protein]-S-L-cysteine hydrolase
MTLTLAKNVFHEMLEAAQEVVPLEACGLLAGTGERATKCYTLTNADASPEHFSMLPEEQFAAVKDMRLNGLQMLAIWHSHPASPARMSAEDTRLAYTPGVVYVILSLAQPGAPRIRAFAPEDDIAHETPIVIEEKEG